MRAAAGQENRGSGRELVDLARRVAQEDGAGGDEMELRPTRLRAEAEAEGRRDLDATVLNAPQAHVE